MVAQNKGSIPGNNDFDAGAAWAAWLQGKVAMHFSWPPTGRTSENYSQRSKAVNFVPSSSIVGKVGYAVMPGGAPEMASGYVKALTTDSQNKDAAYLFMQWTTCPAVSLVMPGWQDYALALDRMCTAVWAGEDPKQALVKGAAEWDGITQKIGVDSQRAAYQQFMKVAGSYPDHTTETLGLAVHIT
jgi:multiple sugar transport system substrate-binding protein